MSASYFGCTKYSSLHYSYQCQDEDKSSLSRKCCLFLMSTAYIENTIVLPAKSDNEVMFCLQSYQGLIIDGSWIGLMHK